MHFVNIREHILSIGHLMRFFQRSIKVTKVKFHILFSYSSESLYARPDLPATLLHTSTAHGVHSTATAHDVHAVHDLHQV